MYLNQYWKDERLAFSNGDDILTLSGDFAEKIWVPDTYFDNDKNRYGVVDVFIGRTGPAVVHFSTQAIDSRNSLIIDIVGRWLYH